MKLDHTEGKDGPGIHNIIARPSGETPGEGIISTWYEASISSTSARTILRENETLTLGDEAQWTLQMLVDAGALEAIYKPALQMVKAMDGVGVKMDNGPGRASAATALSPQGERRVLVKSSRGHVL